MGKDEIGNMKCWFSILVADRFVHEGMRSDEVEYSVCKVIQNYASTNVKYQITLKNTN
jgi:hypothetical protein